MGGVGWAGSFAGHYLAANGLQFLIKGDCWRVTVLLEWLFWEDVERGHLDFLMYFV